MKAWKAALAFTSVISLAAMAVLFKRVRTMLNIRHIGGKLYKVDYRADYKLDKLLAKGVKDVAGLTSFLSKEIYMGYPINVNENISGCTSFAAKSPTGELLVGRNFDYPKTGMLLVHTKPKNGYASHSMVCLSHLDISEDTGTMPETRTKRIGRRCSLTARCLRATIPYRFSGSRRTAKTRRRSSMSPPY